MFILVDNTVKFDPYYEPPEAQGKICPIKETNKLSFNLESKLFGGFI